jgi:DNA-binding NarL/FixJ family response regulator
VLFLAVARLKRIREFTERVLHCIYATLTGQTKPVNIDRLAARRGVVEWFMPATRLLLIDDHALFRLGIKLVLEEGIAGVEVLEADSLIQGMKACEQQPTLVVLDVQLQGVNGLEGLGLLKSRWPDVPVIMLSSQSEPDMVRLALARGAAAFAFKAESTEKILTTIHQTLASVLGRPRETDNRSNGPLAPDKPQLTPRQCEVLDLLCEGLSNKAIARRLDISEFTARGHVQALLGVLQANSRAQAILAARRWGLIR